jgi:agmatine deiminase
MSPPKDKPVTLGYRPVGEWEHNSACWTAWPYDPVGWGDFLGLAQREFVGFCDALLTDAASEQLRILVPDADAESAARAALGALSERVAFHRLAYGDIWLRDTTPIFVRSDAGMAAVRFAFNGWGGKYVYPGDAELSAALSARLGLPDFAFETVLEGGAVEFDGLGTCLTTDSCLLNPNRGDSLTREKLNAVLRDAFGVSTVLWLRDGLAFDHTDGHIDNVARFVAPGIVMHTRARRDDDPNAATYAAIEADLARATDAGGRALQLLAVPSPGHVADANGDPLAASHLNFYIGNRVIVVPGFGGDSDELARRAIASAFPDRRVLVRSARSILEGGGGTFHCMTRQQPRSRA